MLSTKRTLMNSAWQTLLTGLFATCFVLTAQVSTTTPNYTTSALNGTYILYENGTNQQSQSAYAAVANLVLDGAGNVSGVENLAAEAFGVMGNTVTGSYTIGNAGWGTMALTIAFADGSGTTVQANYSVLLTSQGVVVERTDNGVFAQSSLVPQSQGAFSNANAIGNFVLQEHGYSSNGACALMGVLTFDGQGNVSGTASYQSLGTNYMAAVTGIYTINPNGSGNMTLTLTATNPDGTTASTNFTYALNMVTSAGTTAALSTDPGTTAYAMISSR